MVDVASLLPPNATPVEKALEQSTARIGAVEIEQVSALWNPQTCPVELLPWLAWALSVDTWNTDWSEATKRSVIAATPTIKRLKGTEAAVVAAVASFGGEVMLQRWCDTDPPGQPGTFSLVFNVSPTSGEAATAEFVDEVVAAVTAAKSLRDHFTFTQALQSSATVGVIGYARAAAFTRLSMQVAA